MDIAVKMYLGIWVVFACNCAAVTSVAFSGPLPLPYDWLNFTGNILTMDTQERFNIGERVRYHVEAHVTAGDGYATSGESAEFTQLWFSVNTSAFLSFSAQMTTITFTAPDDTISQPTLNVTGGETVLGFRAPETNAFAVSSYDLNRVQIVEFDIETNVTGPIVLGKQFFLSFGVSYNSYSAAFSSNTSFIFYPDVIMAALDSTELVSGTPYYVTITIPNIPASTVKLAMAFTLTHEPALIGNWSLIQVYNLDELQTKIFSENFLSQSFQTHSITFDYSVVTSVDMSITLVLILTITSGLTDSWSGRACLQLDSTFGDHVQTHQLPVSLGSHGALYVRKAQTDVDVIDACPTTPYFENWVICAETAGMFTNGTQHFFLKVEIPDDLYPYLCLGVSNDSVETGFLLCATDKVIQSSAAATSMHCAKTVTLNLTFTQSGITCEEHATDVNLTFALYVADYAVNVTVGENLALILATGDSNLQFNAHVQDTINDTRGGINMALLPYVVDNVAEGETINHSLSIVFPSGPVSVLLEVGVSNNSLAVVNITNIAVSFGGAINVKSSEIKFPDHITYYFSPTNDTFDRVQFTLPYICISDSASAVERALHVAIATTVLTNSGVSMDMYFIWTKVTYGAVNRVTQTQISTVNVYPRNSHFPTSAPITATAPTSSEQNLVTSAPGLVMDDGVPRLFMTVTLMTAGTLKQGNTASLNVTFGHVTDSLNSTSPTDAYNVTITCIFTPYLTYIRHLYDVDGMTVSNSSEFLSLSFAIFEYPRVLNNLILEIKVDSTYSLDQALFGAGYLSVGPVILEHSDRYSNKYDPIIGSYEFFIERASYQPLGCFRHNRHRAFPDLVANYRGVSIDWQNMAHSFNSIIKWCAEEVAARRTSHPQRQAFLSFGIKYYGECWSGDHVPVSYWLNHASSHCEVYDVGGSRDSMFVYKLNHSRTWPQIPEVAASQNCACRFDPTSHNCACCDVTECQCGRVKPGNCARCNYLDFCEVEDFSRKESTMELSDQESIRCTSDGTSACEDVPCCSYFFPRAGSQVIEAIPDLDRVLGYDSVTGTVYGSYRDVIKESPDIRTWFSVSPNRLLSAQARTTWRNAKQGKGSFSL